MIKRQRYIDWLERFRGKDVIKVLTGVRRSGKSTLFNSYIEHLKLNGISADQIVYINFEDLGNEKLCDYNELYKYILSLSAEKKQYFIFIDEIQQCNKFEKVVSSLLLKRNLDIYITGSNASLLSGELATLLAGRYVAIEVLPLSFKEYLLFNESQQKSLQEIFNDYLLFGSFPYVPFLNNRSSDIYLYLEGIFNTILIRDVVTREKNSDVTLLQNIVKCLITSIGSPISTKKIADTLKSQGRAISVNTIEQYINALKKSFIFYEVMRYDLKGKNFLKTLSKFYLIDTGLRNLLVHTKELDQGHLLENIVYFELLRRFTKVSIGKIAQAEIDFVAENMNGVAYFQVASSVLDPNTLERELRPFKIIDDNYPKYLLTLDTVPANTNYNGIIHKNIINFLMDE